ncbi:MAG: hypothetical protein GF333_03080 [Candidatus Omnitrophica bacterium]|nr:hypothetical protein [Candidatus Omnitrophota bacterium]
MKYALAVCAVITLILVLSLLPVAEIKTALKGMLEDPEAVRAWFKRVLPVRITPTMVQNILHVPFFAGLAWVSMRALTRGERSGVKAVMLTAVIVCGISVLSEGMQFFSLERDPGWGDFLLDMGGGIGGAGVFLIRERRKFRGRTAECELQKDE